MKVAFATEDLQHVDAHFGWASKMAIFEILPDNYQLLNIAEFSSDDQEDGNEDKLIPRLEAIADCSILYVSAIGGSGAARVVAMNIHPVKVAQTEVISDLIARLQTVICGTPPPWLRKALNKGKARNFDFEDEVLHD